MTTKHPSSDLMAALVSAAQELVTAPPASWAGWIAFLLEEIEAQDEDAAALGDYDDMLAELSKIVVHRIARGGW